MKNPQIPFPSTLYQWPLLAMSLLLFSGVTARPGLPLKNAETTASDYPVIDAYARATPETYARNLNTLADYLTAPARSDLGKARSIYTWILTHIHYNYASGGNGYYTSELDYASQVLKSRKAVCTGYALLFKYMLLRAGVDCRNIKGYARTRDTDAGLPIRQQTHEWNAVNIDGDWYLFDLAWAGATGQNHESNDYYFLTNPATFIASHFPADPRWQLRSPAISKAAFDHYPKVYDAYFRLGFDPDFPRDGLLRATETVTVSLDHPSAGMVFTAMVGLRGGITRSVLVEAERVGESYQLTIPIAQRGTSQVLIFGGPKGHNTSEALISLTAVRN